MALFYIELTTTQNTNTKTRKRMNMERSLHPKPSVLRICLPRHLGGRGLLSLERLHNRVVLTTACYVMRGTDPLNCFVREHEKADKGAFPFKSTIRVAEELSLAIDFTRRCQQSITELAPTQLKTHIKAADVEFLLKPHKDKPIQGIFYKYLEEHGLSQQLTFSFLRSSGLKSETEEPADRRHRCKTYAATAYVHRHNAALRVLYYHLRHSYGIDETPVLPYAPGDIESVIENERCRIYWNYSFSTLELVQANKPDIVLLDHQQNTMFVIQFSASAKVNVVSKEEKKRTKYQELLGRLRRLWPDYAPGGMRNTLLNTLLSALRAVPVCRAEAHILAARMQKATEHVRNDDVLRMAGLEDRELFEHTKKRKISYLGHIIRGERYEFQRLILQGKIESEMHWEEETVLAQKYPPGTGRSDFQSIQEAARNRTL
nr:unnamed protein product [Callosobruchus chinensis]